MVFRDAITTVNALLALKPHFLAWVCFAWSCESIVTTAGMQTYTFDSFINASLIS